jgi:hypothetical protein
MNVIKVDAQHLEFELETNENYFMANPYNYIIEEFMGDRMALPTHPTLMDRFMEFPIVLLDLSGDTVGLGDSPTVIIVVGASWIKFVSP